MTAMSEPSPSAGQTTSGDPVSAADAGKSLALLGMLAYGELAAFSRLAGDAAMAPTLAQRLELSRLAGRTLARLDRVDERVAQLGEELRPVMEPFAGLLTEFDERTVPSTWWERLLKAYVGYGVADDFIRMVAAAVDPTTRDLVVEVLADDGHATLVVDSLAAASGSDPTLASRLALWGRRLVGESLGVVQGVIAEHQELAALLDEVVADLPGAGDAQQRLFSVLTAEHTRRMDRLGLTA